MVLGYQYFSPLQMKNKASPGVPLAGGHRNEQPSRHVSLLQPRDLYFNKPSFQSTPRPPHCECLESPLTLLFMQCDLLSTHPHMQLIIPYFSFPQLLHVHQETYHYRQRCPLDPCRLRCPLDPRRLRCPLDPRLDI